MSAYNTVHRIASRRKKARTPDMRDALVFLEQLARGGGDEYADELLEALTKN